MSFLIFKERLTIKMCLGMAIIIFGVIWVALSKSGSEGQNERLVTSDEFYYKMYAIGAALASGMVAALRPIQAKWIDIHHQYGPFEFSIDSGFVTGFALMLFWAYYCQIGQDSYTPPNYLYSFLGSTFMMLWGLVGLNSMVKGLQGPSSAIQQAHSLISILLCALFLGQIPNISQCLACLTLIMGVVLLIFYR